MAASDLHSKKRWWAAWLPIAALLVTTGCGAPIKDAESDLHSDSGIRGPAYSAIVKEMEELAAGNSDWVKLFNYGQTAQGRKLLMLRFGKPRSSGQSPAIYISGSTHGDEFLGIENNLPAWMVKNRETSPGLKKFLDGNGLVYIIPIFNPDGYDNRTRGNTSGTDLNRDYDGKTENVKNFRHPETKKSVDTLYQDISATQAKLKFTLDYHCCFGALIYPWAHTRTPLPTADRNRHVSVGNLMKKFFPNYKLGQVFDVISYTASGSSSDYFYETFGADAFAFEGAEGREDKNMTKHTEMWNELFAHYAEAGDGASDDGENPLRLAIAGDHGGGTVTVKLSAKRAHNMEICAGDSATCTGSTKPLQIFTEKTQVGDRLIFTSTEGLSLGSSGTTLTLLAKDTDGRLLSSQTVRIGPHP